ncbi:hypothetical protein ABT097_23695 [Streptomyces sp. NPDC002225]|uniref:hypothetical protein n=1 Tax=Streptomyces sp. NPDC002225 TaxID=3154413 RepID=UPI00333439B1
MSTSERLAPSAARLLPWVRPDGGPCYLSTEAHGYVSRIADRMELVQLRTGADVLECAGPIIASAGSTVLELRFTAARLAECLTDALRVAESRGGRLRQLGAAECDEDDGEDDWYGAPEADGANGP